VEFLMNFVGNSPFRLQDLNHEKAGSNLTGVDAVIGNEVENPAGEELGHVKELIFDINSGQIIYAVIEIETGSRNDKYFAVPWEALTMDSINSRCVLNIARERLKVAQGFNKTDWPDMNDNAWQKQVKQFYGTGASSESRQ
jgi:sporulation protein YlmC with PRC-barrel domain